MKQEPVYIPHVACPSCGELSAIGYTTKGQEYIWWCDNDECGKQYRWRQNEDGSIDAEPTGTVITCASVLLRLEPQDKPLFLIVKGIKHEDSIQRYFYNEHTCPVNYLRETKELYLGDIQDPHGVFEYVGTTDKRKGATLDDFNATYKRGITS